MRQRTPFRRVDVCRVQALLSRSDLLVLDARDADSFATSHIDGAQPVSSGTVGAVIRVTAKNRPILIYCYHGNASREYAQTFSDFGFTEVYSLDGGYEAWRSQPIADASVELDAALQQWLAAQHFPAGDINSVIANATTAADESIPQRRPRHRSPADHGRRGPECAQCRRQQRLVAGMRRQPSACHRRAGRGGIDIDNQNDNGATPLMYAASSGKSAIVERLLAKGADVTAETLDGFSALDLAGTIECLALLRPGSARPSPASPATLPNP